MSENITRVRGYKVFNPDWTCSPNGIKKQYTCPGIFEEDIAVICNSGMHFCKKLSDCFSYYSFNPDNRVAEVVAYGNVIEQCDKCCTDKLEIIRELTWYEVLDLVNTGNHNSGNHNSGNHNSGNWNSGNCNSGNCNSGNRNSGNWNSGDYSNGCFNTVSPKIWLFNKPSNWTYSDWRNSTAHCLMSQIPCNVLDYIRWSDMSDVERKSHPEAEITGGYLKELNDKNCAKIWWKKLSDDDKQIITSLPNFDKGIFMEITGIDVDS